MESVKDFFSGFLSIFVFLLSLLIPIAIILTIIAVPSYFIFHESCDSKTFSLEPGDKKCGVTYLTEKDNLVSLKTGNDYQIVKPNIISSYNNDASLKIKEVNKHNIVMEVSNYDNFKSTVLKSVLLGGGVGTVIVIIFIGFIVFMASLGPQF